MSTTTRVEGFPSDQPSILYAFTEDDETQIREVSRAGSGHFREGDITTRDTTQSNPTEHLPELDIPGSRGPQQDDCGDDIPAFACSDCGAPKYVGRTCYSPVCERCWPAHIKQRVVTGASKLEGLRRRLYAKYDGNKDIDFNHVVASPPDDFRLDSSTPLKRTLKIIKSLLEGNWHIEGFYAIYHPYRIKMEYRKDQYNHGGEKGEGDMTWKDVLNADNPEQYIYYSPHFHLLFPAIRKSFDYMTAEHIHNKSGWLFHRITKGENSNVSVRDYGDLVHQMTYCLSHAGVEYHEEADSKMATSMKGKLHNTYAPDGTEDQTLNIISEAAPKLLGYSFVNTQDTPCDADVPTNPDDEEHDHPMFGGDGESSSSDDTNTVAEEIETTTCGGELVNMANAPELLDDPQWREQAIYADALDAAYQEWRDRRDDLDGDVDGDRPPD